MPPAQMLFERIPRSHLDLIKPNISQRVKDKKSSQQRQHDEHAKPRVFTPGDPVFVKDFPSGKKWLTGEIFKAEGPHTYQISLLDGCRIRRHVGHIRHHTSEPTQVLAPELDLLTGPSEAIPEVNLQVPETPQPDTTLAPRASTQQSTRNVSPPTRLTYGPNFEPRTFT